MLTNKSRVHLVGVGGIGMSGLAQLLAAVGCQVSGSDRDSGKSENQPLFEQLKQQNIKIYPQDGSFAQDGKVDYLIYSSAVEEGNKDFIAAGDTPRLHRSAAMEQAIKLYGGNAVTIAVAGSSGKTSVTAYLAEVLDSLTGGDTGCLDGGMVKRFARPPFPGNFHPGKKYFVFEADESDKSLINYQVDYAIILNIGHDHYSEEELAKVFTQFAQNVRLGLVVSKQVKQAIGAGMPEHLRILTVADAVTHRMTGDVDFTPTRYYVSGGRARMELNGVYHLVLPQPGLHTALNMSCVAAMAELLGYKTPDITDALSSTGGAGRRFELLGLAKGRIPIYDDYAHNPEKLACALQTAQELVEGKIIMLWQPHGYGPLNFMRQALVEKLLPVLRKNDVFILLEPFYAGGTSSFSPHAVEVINEWHTAKLAGENVFTLPCRAAVAQFLQENITDKDLVLICGGRDNSLPVWVGQLAQILS